MSLEPIKPKTALELYLADRENELSQATIYSHKSRIGHLIRWCNENSIENLNELTGRKLQQYRIWRRNEGNLRPASEKTQMDTIRVFIRWLESIDAVIPDMSTKVLSPTLSIEDKVRDVRIDKEQIDPVLTHLKKYEYASLKHVSLTLLWKTMMRIGAAHALDLEDYYPDEQYLQVVHRPERGTAIKNKKRGERYVALSGETCALLDDWIESKRADSTDDYDRKPLLTTNQGRMAKSTLRDYCYQETRPCSISGICPDDRDLESCKATHRDHAAKCPFNVSPHAIRRGSITNALNNDIPSQVVGDRANVSQSVLEKHYDRRTKKEKMEQRRGFLDNI